MKDLFELLPGVPHKLDAAVTRVIAPNGGVMTGPGTNTYLVGTRELIVIDPVLTMSCTCRRFSRQPRARSAGSYALILMQITRPAPPGSNN